MNSAFRIRKIPSSRKSSAPFLSGDSFMLLADYAFIREFDLRYLVILLGQVKTDVELGRKILFIEVSALERAEIRNYLLHWFENLFGNSTQNLTVLIHNGDQIPDGTFFDLLVGKGIDVYSVNSTQQYSGIKPLPIGLENKHLRGNGIGRLFVTSKDHKFRLNPPVDQITEVFASFNLFTNLPERSDAKSQILKFGYNFTDPNLSRKKYQAGVRQSRFVISPPGNGIDCHRTWEAIYLGAVPVVLKKCLHEELIKLFPIIAVNEWEEFLGLSGNEKNNLALQFDGLKYPAMTMDYWGNLLRGRNDSDLDAE